MCPQYHPPRQRNSMPPRVAQGTEECEGFDASTRSQMRLGDMRRVLVVRVENGEAAPPTPYLLLDRLFFARTPHLAPTITESQQLLAHAGPSCRAATGPSFVEVCPTLTQEQLEGEKHQNICGHCKFLCRRSPRDLFCCFLPSGGSFIRCRAVTDLCRLPKGV